MAYSTGMLRHRILIVQQAKKDGGMFGKGSGGMVYEAVKRVWAAVDFNKGVKAMREGALDAYDTLMVRIRYTDKITRDSLIFWEGKIYMINSFNVDYHTNQIQMTVTEQVTPSFALLFVLRDKYGKAIKDCDGRIITLQKSFNTN